MHRECGNLPSSAKCWTRLCYEREAKGLFLEELHFNLNLWNVQQEQIILRDQRQGRTTNAMNRNPVLRHHFNALLGTTATGDKTSSYIWSRGASDKLVSDDALVCSCFVPDRDTAGMRCEDSRQMTWSSLLRSRQKRHAKNLVKIDAKHTRYYTKSPAIHVSHVPQHNAYVFGFMGSGLESGKVVVHRSKYAHQMLPAQVCVVEESQALHSGTLVYKTGGTIWNAELLDGSHLVSMGEREASRILQIGEARIQSVWKAKYTSDVLAQAAIRDRSVVLHGLRNGQVHLADWRTRARSESRSLMSCKAGRSIMEILSVPQDPHQFAVLGYSQLPRLWDIRMQRPIVRYASSHLDTIDLLHAEFGDKLPMNTIDSLKLGGTKSLRISSDNTLLGCIKQLKSVSFTASLDLIHIWSLKTGKTVSLSKHKGLKGMGYKDFLFLDDRYTSQLNLPANSMICVEQCEDMAERLQAQEIDAPLDTRADGYVKLVSVAPCV